MKGVHHCEELQENWKQFKPESFFFGIFVIGPEWQDEQKRIEKERELIALNFPVVYNKLEQSRKIKYKIPVLYKNEFFPQ
jgi:hypothetical protein